MKALKYGFFIIAIAAIFYSLRTIPLKLPKIEPEKDSDKNDTKKDSKKDSKTQTGYGAKHKAFAEFTHEQDPQ